jgi:hypothetical protein
MEENHMEVMDKLSEMEEEMARCKRVMAQRKGQEEEGEAQAEEQQTLKRISKNKNILDMMHLYMEREDERRKEAAMKAAAARAGTRYDLIYPYP